MRGEQHIKDSDAGTNELLARLERLEARDRRARWWRRTALALLVLAVSVPFAAEALGPVPNSFTNGAIISASEMNANFTHLQDAITAMEAKVPAATCGAGQISRYSGSVWECSEDVDTTLTTSDPNLSIATDVISLSSDLSVTSVSATTVSSTNLDAAVSIQWNNSVSNGTTEMSVFSHASTCNDTTRGRIRMWRHEDIGNSLDLGDALCFCQQYVDRTPATDVTTYRWVCLYPQSDGN